MSEVTSKKLKNIFCCYELFFGEKSFPFTDRVVCLRALCNLKRDIFVDSNFGNFPNFSDVF